MTEQEIRDRMNRKISDFMNEPVPHNLPAWFYKKFQDVFMVISQMQVQFQVATVDSILKKVSADQPERLTRHEVIFISDVWLAMPPINIEKDIQKFILKRRFLEEIKGKLDTHLLAKKEAVERETDTLRKNNRQVSLIRP